jgi:hypothetical protein
MSNKFRARPFPTADDIRAAYAEIRSIPLTAARCGVSIDLVRDALLARAS